MATVTSLYNCPCSGAFPIQGSVANAVNRTVGVVNLPAGAPPGMQQPYQFRTFESAAFSDRPQIAILPYSPGTIVAASPVYYGDVLGNAPTAGVAAATAVNAAATAPNPYPTYPPLDPYTANSTTVSYAPPIGYRANECGCTTVARSQLPPSGFSAWEPLIRQFNAPYDSFMGPTCSRAFDNLPYVKRW